jgi:alpha-tubulin suppressor-like RCC1 family protein
VFPKNVNEVKGRLGDGTISKNIVSDPVLNNLSGVTQLSLGARHGCAQLGDRKVHCWGANEYDARKYLLLGRKGENNSLPSLVANLDNVEYVSASSFHTCALSMGDVYCWGHNGNGQLGYDGLDTLARKVDLPDNKKALQISTGYLHTCAVLDDLSAVCWGSNGSGQLGNGPTESSFVPTPVTGLSNIKQISAGTDHTCAVLNSGEVHCWGDGSSGQLGNGSYSDSNTSVPVIGLDSEVVSKVYAANTFSCALVETGNVYCWGAYPRTSGVQLPAYGNIASLFISSENVVKLSARSLHACVVLNTGTVRCWGKGDKGQLGNGGTASSSISESVFTVNRINDDLPGASDISVGYETSCAILNDGQVVCWGNNETGQLGQGSYFRTLPNQVLELTL